MSDQKYTAGTQELPPSYPSAGNYDHQQVSQQPTHTDGAYPFPGQEQGIQPAQQQPASYGTETKGGAHPPQQQALNNLPQSGAVMPIPSLTSAPAPVQCPNCNQRAMTKVELHSGNTTHAWAVGLCLLTCCCCIPYCVSSTKDVEQRCSNCNTLLATWHRSGRTEVHLM